MARLSNPFMPASSKLMSSSSDSLKGDIQFHTVEKLKESKFCITEKAVDLHNAKSLIIKYMNITPDEMQRISDVMADLKQSHLKASSLVKYHSIRFDEDSEKFILICEYCKMIDLKESIEKYGYQDEQKAKIIAFQVVKALQKLASVSVSHGRLNLSNVMISPRYKVKLADYFIHTLHSTLSLKDALAIDLFNLGVILLKLLGKCRADEHVDMYTYDKRSLREFYKSEGITCDLKSFLDVLLVKRHADLDVIELHPFLQITDNDITPSLSKLSSDSQSTNNEHITESVKCEFTFRSNSEDKDEKGTESEEPDPALGKFLTNSSETTSMQDVKEDPMTNMHSLIPKCSEQVSSHAKHVSAKDDKTLSNLDSKYDSSFEDDEENENPTGLLMADQPNLQQVVNNVNKRMSKINFPGVRIGRLSKDDFESEYQRELLAQIKMLANNE